MESFILVHNILEYWLTILHARVRLSKKQISRNRHFWKYKTCSISHGVHSHYQLIPFLKVHLSNMLHARLIGNYIYIYIYMIKEEYNHNRLIGNWSMEISEKKHTHTHLFSMFSENSFQEINQAKKPLFHFLPPFSTIITETFSLNTRDCE